MPFVFPHPFVLHPVRDVLGKVHTGTVFLKAAIDHPRIDVGDYSYASSFSSPDDWAVYLAPYLFDFSPERLQIGKFCQIADGVQFITSSANHRMDGISTYPFAIFSGERGPDAPSLPSAGPDTCIGNDVWIGQGAKILPGAQIGDGVIIGAGAVVAGIVPAYSVVGGTPAKVIRHRFKPEAVERLLEIAWWDWPIEVILLNQDAICGGDVDALGKVIAKLAR